jgi:molybdate transport system ATP-binding protein
LENFEIKTIENIHSIPSLPVPLIKSPEHSSNEPIVEMRDLTIRYDKKEIIRQFNWKVHKGERWALTGPNGSGKTTIFSLIYADHPMAYSQQVYLFGKRRGTGESIWDIKKRINYLGPELLTYLNPFNIISSAYDFILQHHKLIDKDQLNDVISYFQAEYFIYIPMRFLSSGQLQLTLIIGSLLSDKELLLLDEPFQFLDPKQQYLLTNYLNDHLHTDTTLILITHYEEDILHWTNHRMILP